MFHKSLFVLAHQAVEWRFYPTYKKLVQNQQKSSEELRDEQEKQLRHMIEFAYQNVPYYRVLLRSMKLSPNDIERIEDLERLPVLTKETIRENWEDLKPVELNRRRYYECATGGSTGTPLRFRLSKFDRFLAGALMYRGWGYAGYKLADKMVFLGGSSLDIGKRSGLSARVHEVIRNIRKLSSFDMGERDMRQYVDALNSFKPKFLRGYASAIHLFSRWLQENNVEIHQPLAILTTAEKLYPNMREEIQDVFGCDVFDAYGLNDGGLGAYECLEHCGLHIDTERSVMEVVDKDGNQVKDGKGKILATSLHNYAMPFIRYDTGDLGRITDVSCDCGRESGLLREIVGRSVDILVTPEGKKVHGWFFLYIFWEYCKGVKEYQVVQKNLNEVVIRIVADKDFEEKQLDMIREAIRRRSEGWDVRFEFVDSIDRAGSGKFKFIINAIE